MYLAGLGILVSTVLASRANAGADMIIDNSAQAPPPPAYSYAPPPPVYYVPPPPPIVVYPTVGFYRPVRAFGYHRWYAHRGYRGGHRWR